MTQDFQTALTKFVEVAQSVVTEHCTANGYPIPTLSVSEGKKFVKIIRTDANNGQRSVHAFVNKENGAVLKAAGWKVPAKGDRGNIYDPDCGAEAVTPWGIRYLK